MKLLCDEALRAELLLFFQDYQHLPIAFVQKGYAYEGVCIQFDPQHLEEVRAITDAMKQSDKPAIIAYQNEEMYLIPPEDIVYIEGYRKDAYLHTMATSYEITYRLYELEEQLTPLGFMRINKSMIVNIRMIHRILPALNACYTMELKNGISLECSRQYWKQCKKILRGR